MEILYSVQILQAEIVLYRVLVFVSEEYKKTKIKSKPDSKDSGFLFKVLYIYQNSLGVERMRGIHVTPVRFWFLAQQQNVH